MGLTKDALRQLWANITARLDEKVDKVPGKGLSTNDYSNAEKAKLTNIEEGANRTIVDSTLSATSTNPVESQAIYTAINSVSGNYSKAVIAMSIEDNIITYYTVDGQKHTMEIEEYPLGTPTIEGLTKLYATTGQATDGTMTQKAITDELNKKLSEATITNGTLIITR
jgi:hypothetical protein